MTTIDHKRIAQAVSASRALRDAVETLMGGAFYMPPELLDDAARAAATLVKVRAGLLENAQAFAGLTGDLEDLEEYDRRRLAAAIIGDWASMEVENHDEHLASIKSGEHEASAEDIADAQRCRDNVAIAAQWLEYEEENQREMREYCATLPASQVEQEKARTRAMFDRMHANAIAQAQRDAEARLARKVEAAEAVES